MVNTPVRFYTVSYMSSNCAPGGVVEQFTAHQTLLVALRTQQVGAVGGGTSDTVTAGGSSGNEVSSLGTAVDHGHKSLVEMRQERQVHPNMESVFSIQTWNL